MGCRDRKGTVLLQIIRQVSSSRYHSILSRIGYDSGSTIRDGSEKVDLTEPATAAGCVHCSRCKRSFLRGLFFSERMVELFEGNGLDVQPSGCFKIFLEQSTNNFFFSQQTDLRSSSVDGVFPSVS